MNFDQLKKELLNPRSDKRLRLCDMKLYHSDFNNLLKIIARVERELPAIKRLLHDVLYGQYNLPKSYNELHKSKLPVLCLSLDKQLNWLAAGFLKFSDQINQFLKLRSEFEYLLLMGDYDEARKILDKVEKEICVSYWSIENRFILDEYQYSTEKNWETRQILSDKDTDPFVAVLGNLYSYKTEKRISFFQYNDEFTKWQEQEGLNKEENVHYVEYFRFKANYFSHYEYNLFAMLLNMEESASVIDRYIIFIRISSHLIVNKKYNADNLTNVLLYLSQTISDKNIKQILVIKGKSKLENSNNKIIRAIDEYTIGNYAASRCMLKEILLNENQTYIELIELFNKCLIEEELPYEDITSKNSIINQISKDYYDVLSKNENCDIAYVDILKLSYVFNNSGVGLQLYSFIKEDLGWETGTQYTALARLSSNFYNPKIWETIYHSQEDAEVFINQLIQESSESITHRLYENFHLNYQSGSSTQLDELKTEKSQLYYARTLLLREDINEAIIRYEQILTGNLSIVSQYEAISNLYSCYLQKKKYRSCVEIYVNAYIRNPHLVKRCKPSNAIEAITTEKFKNVGNIADLIELPIFFKINNAEKIKIKHAYEKFLNANNCKRPSELIKLYKNFEKGKLIYFLRHVCVTEIMQLSKYNSSTHNVNEERIIVCQFLADFDKDNLDIYNSEIATSTQRNIINKVIGNIDERKIYVNDEKLKGYLLKVEKPSAVQKEHSITLNRDSFERFISLVDFVKQNEYMDLDSFLHYLETGERQITRKIINEQNAIRNEKVFKIFKDFFTSIRDLFVFNLEYGLDVYLGSKIRHGTLPNHFRSVFENYNLVTSQTDGVYSENKYWTDRLSISNEKNEKVQTLLATFSKRIDDISKLLKEGLIQCRTEKRNGNQAALFDYSYHDGEITFLFLQHFSNIKEYEHFVEKSISELWTRTEYNLDKIRAVIDGSLKTELYQVISDLENDLLKSCDRNEINELLNNINICRTEMQTKLGNIANWFKRSENTFERKYDLKILIEASIQIIKNINPSYNFDIEKNINVDLFLKGEYHQHFIDVMGNFLHNMIRHSKLEVNELNAKLDLNEVDGKLIMVFSNKVHHEKVNQAEMIGKLEKAKRNWSTPEMHDVGDEDSGFYKIKKSLRSDMGIENINFDYSLIDCYLQITVTIETTGILYENIDN